MFLLFLKAVDILVMLLIGLIIASALMSWFPKARSGSLVKMIHRLIDPILEPIRKLIQKSIFGGSNMAIDIAPFIAYLVLSTLHRSLTYYIGSSWQIF